MKKISWSRVRELPIVLEANQIGCYFLYFAIWAATFFFEVNILWNGFSFACQGSQQHWTWKKTCHMASATSTCFKKFFEKYIWVVVGVYTTFSDMLTRFFLTFFPDGKITSSGANQRKCQSSFNDSNLENRMGPGLFPPCHC